MTGRGDSSYEDFMREHVRVIAVPVPKRPKTTVEHPDNTGKGSGPWQCYGCLARLESLSEGFATACPECGSHEIHYAPVSS